MLSADYRHKFPEPSPEDASEPAPDATPAAPPASWATRASRVLDRFGALVDPLLLLDSVPADTPLHVVAPFLQRALPRRTHARNTGAVAVALARRHALRTREQLLRARKCSFAAHGDARCPECMQLLDERAAVSAHPLSALVEPSGALPPHLQLAVEAASGTPDPTRRPRDMGIVIGTDCEHVLMHYRCSKKVSKRTGDRE
jgi:hypothetical protein